MGLQASKPYIIDEIDSDEDFFYDEREAQEKGNKDEKTKEEGTEKKDDEKEASVQNQEEDDPVTAAVRDADHSLFPSNGNKENVEPLMTQKKSQASHLEKVPLIDPLPSDDLPLLGSSNIPADQSGTAPSNFLFEKSPLRGSDPITSSDLPMSSSTSKLPVFRGLDSTLSSTFADKVPLFSSGPDASDDISSSSNIPPYQQVPEERLSRDDDNATVEEQLKAMALLDKELRSFENMEEHITAITPSPTNGRHRSGIPKLQRARTNSTCSDDSDSERARVRGRSVSPVTPGRTKGSGIPRYGGSRKQLARLESNEPGMDEGKQAHFTFTNCENCGVRIYSRHYT